LGLDHQLINLNHQRIPGMNNVQNAAAIPGLIFQHFLGQSDHYQLAAVLTESQSRRPDAAFLCSRCLQRLYVPAAASACTE
jgi:hypothetical protein